MTPLCRLLSKISIEIIDFDPNKIRMFTLLNREKCSPSVLEKKIMAVATPAFSSQKITEDEFRNLISSKFAPSLVDELTVWYNQQVPEPDELIEISDVDKEIFKNVALYKNILDDTDFPYFITLDGLMCGASAKMYMKLFKVKNPELIAETAIPQYKPRLEEGSDDGFHVGNTTIKIVNTYMKPRWKKEATASDADISLFHKLFNHLFVLEEEKNYVRAWVKMAITKRAPTYLIMSGAGGNGKNRFKMVLKGLVGHHNLVDGKESTINEKFNTQLQNAEIIFYDELRWTFANEPRLKEIQNDTISIEAKGIDATRATEIFCSSIITNNYLEHNYIAFDARKFVPVVLNPRNLITSMTSVEISTLTNKLTETHPDYDPNFIAAIYEYFITTGMPEKYPNMEFKGPGFYAMANATMHKWQRQLIAAINFAATWEQGEKPPETLFKQKNFSRIAGKLQIKWSEFFAAMDVSSRSSGSNEYPPVWKIWHFLNDYKNSVGEKICNAILYEPEGNGEFYLVIFKKEKEIRAEDVL